MNTHSKEYLSAQIDRFYAWERRRSILILSVDVLFTAAGVFLFFSSEPLLVGIAIPMLVPTIYISLAALTALRNLSGRRSLIQNAALQGGGTGLEIETRRIALRHAYLGKILRWSGGSMLAGCLGIIISLLVPIGIFFLGLSISLFVITSLASLHAMTAAYRYHMYLHELSKVPVS